MSIKNYGKGAQYFLKNHRVLLYRFLEAPAQIVVEEFIEHFRSQTELFAFRVRVNLERPDFLDQ